MKDKLLDMYWKSYNKVVSTCSPYYYKYFGHKHHIIKTKLTPAAWYDTDTRMLYAVMGLVEWFVENDMQRWTRNEYEDQVDNINQSNRDIRMKEAELEHLSHQYNSNLKIMDIYHWWKNYPNRLKEIDNALHDWSNYVNSFCKDNEFDSFLYFMNNHDKIMTEQEKEIERNKHTHIHNLEMQLDKEEQEMLKQAIELRKCMWS